MSKFGNFGHRSPKKYFRVYKNTLDFLLHFVLIITSFISYVFSCFGFCGRSTSRTFVSVTNFFIVLISTTEVILRGINIYPKLPEIFRNIRFIFPLYAICVFLLFISGCTGMSKHSKNFNFIRIVGCVSSMISSIILFLLLGLLLQYSYENQHYYVENLLREKN